jgi:hypothetical protein
MQSIRAATNRALAAVSCSHRIVERKVGRDKAAVRSRETLTGRRPVAPMRDERRSEYMPASRPGMPPDAASMCDTPEITNYVPVSTPECCRRHIVSN